MGARGAPSCPRRLPLLSVLLLPLLGGECGELGERARARGSPAATRGRPGRGFGRRERRRHPGEAARGAGSRRPGGGPALSGRGRRGTLCHPRPRGRGPAPTEFPGLSGELCSELPGVAGARAPGGNLFSGEKRLPPLRGVQRGGWRRGRRVPLAGSAQVRAAGPGPAAGPTCGARQLCYLRRPGAPASLRPAPGPSRTPAGPVARAGEGGIRAAPSPPAPGPEPAPSRGGIWGAESQAVAVTNV